MIALLQICWEIKMDVASMYNELMEAAAPASHCKLLFQTFSSYRSHLKSQNHLDWKMPLRSTPATSLALPSPPLNHSLSTMVYTSSKYLQGWWLNTGYCKAIAVLDITARYHLLSQEKDVKNQLLMDGRERGQAVMVVFFFCCGLLAPGRGGQWGAQATIPPLYSCYCGSARACPTWQ